VRYSLAEINTIVFENEDTYFERALKGSIINDLEDIGTGNMVLKILNLNRLAAILYLPNN